MPLGRTCCLALSLMTAAGCGGSEDPLGGPFGGPYGGNTAGVALPSADSGLEGANGSADAAGAADGNGAQGMASGSGPGTPASPGSGSSGAATIGPSSGSTMAGSVASGTSTGAGPTWTMIYNAYMKSGTVGNCSSTFCHPQAGTPTGAYSYLQSNNYMSGSPPRLVEQGQSCLSWYGGNMPIGRAGSDNTQAVMDMNAWAAAGAKDN